MSARLILPKRVPIAKREDLEPFRYTCSVIFKREEDQYLFGPILIANVRDRQGDIYDDREVEKAAWRFARNGFVADYMHKMQLGPKDAAFVESFVYRPDVFGGPLTIAKRTYATTTWFGGSIVGDEIWKQVKEGKINGYSITGYAKKIAEAEE